LAGGVAEEDLDDLRLASGWRVGDVDDVGEAIMVDVGDNGGACEEVVDCVCGDWKVPSPLLA
jgi:hypothetical protein